MSKFSILSRRRLEQAHPELSYLFNEVIKHYECTVINSAGPHKKQQTGGKQQNLLYLAMAVDVVPAPIKWDGVKRFHHFAGYVLGVAQRLYEEGKMTHRVRWGGNWDMDNDLSDQKYSDFPRFELV